MGKVAKTLLKWAIWPIRLSFSILVDSGLKKWHCEKNVNRRLADFFLQKPNGLIFSFCRQA
jgi:hypothetical protein